MQGDIKVELYWKHAPKTCKNFTELVSNTCEKCLHVTNVPGMCIYRQTLGTTLAAYFTGSLRLVVGSEAFSQSSSFCW